MKVGIGILAAASVVLVTAWVFVTTRASRDETAIFQTPPFKHAEDIPKNDDIESSKVTITRVAKIETPSNELVLRTVKNAIRKANDSLNIDDVVVILVTRSAKNQFSWLFEKQELLIDNACQGSLHPERTCVFVHEEKYYNISDLMLVNLFYSGAFPSWRPPGQKWLAFDVEAPPQSRSWANEKMSNETRSAFNISSFFNNDAVIPYVSHDKFVINWEKYHKLKSGHQDFTTKKTKSAVWMVSHCRSQSEREHYVQELQKYIDVDIFGLCGQEMCTERMERMKECEVELLSKYHFYLSFENCLCENYITEKLYKVYSGPVKIIPIVMGLAEYSRFLPHTTYLDVRDFASPKDLASRMEEIKGNKETYNEFIIRKMAAEKRMEPGYPCRLCDYAHEHRNETEHVEDVMDMWSVEKRCKDPREVIPGEFWDYWKNKPLKGRGRPKG